MKQPITTPVVYARRCDKTGEGMNSGWLFGDGAMYIKYEADVIAELRGPNWKDFWSEAWTELSEREDADILDSAFEQDICHWTEWDPSEEDEWYTAHGCLLDTKERVKLYTEELPATDVEIAAVLLKMRGFTVWVREGDDTPGRWTGKQTLGILVWQDDFSDSTGMEISDREVSDWARVYHEGMMSETEEKKYWKIAKNPDEWRFIGHRHIYGEHGPISEKA